MSDVLDRVRDHYHSTGLTRRLKTALAALGPEDQRLTSQQLGSLDQFHTCGFAAIAELAKLAGITADMFVLDFGAGIGGPARFLAATYGCQVRASTSASHSWRLHGTRRSRTCCK